MELRRNKEKVLKHSYFFDSLRWNAAGTYQDENGNAFPLTGEVKIIHTETEWKLDGYMEVNFSEPFRFTNCYRIFSTKQDTTLRWESYNPALGKLQGTFEIVGDWIISCYRSENGTFSGTETLLQKSASEYENAGISFQNGMKMSSWSAVLTAEKEHK